MAVNFLGANQPGDVQPEVFGFLPLPAQTGANYFLSNIAYDWAIGGIPFLAGQSLRGTYFRRQYVEELAPIRKDQFDNQQVPGEQSILGWWLRSQSVFDGGAGITYLDTSVDTTLAVRYNYSEHLDTLGTVGQTTLLPATKSIYTGSANKPVMLRGASRAGVDGLLAADPGVPSLFWINAAGSSTSITMPVGVTSINSLTDDGTNYYMATPQGIYKGAISSNSAPTLLWQVPSTSGNNVIEFVKGRLVGGLDNNVYELVGTGPGLPIPKMTHVNASYVFTSISSSPGAIFLAGNVPGTNGNVWKFTLDTSGTMPVLTSGIEVATMPTGEQINNIFSYVGNFLAIATSKGLRVASIDSNNNLTYGPLVVQSQSGVKGLCGYDRFIFAGNTANALIPAQGFSLPSDASTNDCIIRIDLSQPTTNGGYAYANDLDIHANKNGIFQIVNFGPQSTTSAGMLAISTVNGGIYITDTTQKEVTGFVQTGRVRYNTLEPKHFKQIFIKTQNIVDGNISINVLDPFGGNTSIYTLPSGITTAPIQIGDIGNQKEWLAFRFTIHRGTSNTNVSPILNGYIIRAIPGVDRQSIITLPLACLDRETDIEGNMNGYDGYAFARLNAVRALVLSGNVVTLQNLRYKTALSVIVDNIHFEQQALPGRVLASAGNLDANALGGWLVLTLRTVVAST